MGLEAVVSDIRQKGRQEAEAIRSRTQRDVSDILQAAQAQVEAIKLETEREVREQTARIVDLEVSSANLVVKRQILNTQKDLLDQVYRQALSAVGNLPESFHREALKKLLAQVVREIPQGVVRVNSRDRSTAQQLLAGDPALAGYRLGDPVDIEGGIIVESAGGDIKVDLSYRTFLDRIWESGLKEASDILFG
ncbi:MAG: V-type ATP synthase subunit E family protein [Methanomicrobiales archaeon]|nr:V-type ATP synthase subunit E family protein [Methanomicrobiales archaeon]